MAEKLTDQQVADLLAILRKDASVDTKSNAVTAVKSAIKQHNVPDSCVFPLFDALRLASTSQHSALANAGFTALNHLLTRLSRQEPKYIHKEAKNTLPLIVDRMGDQKDKLRALAVQALTTMYGATPTEAERFVRNVAMTGKNPRAKESSMQWLVEMHNEHGLPFRAYVPTLMELLEDADGMVRDTAKATVIELFRAASGPAKSDLKKQLKTFKVRPAIEAAIVKELAPTSGTASRIESDVRPDSAPLMRPNLGASVSSLHSERPKTPAPEEKPDPVEPTYVNTSRELDEIFREMHAWFEGRETEQNWLKREQSTTKLRRLIAGNASDFADVFLQGCKALLDGIIKAVTSLRTSLSKEGCFLVQDIANAFGPGMDPMVELLMQTFIKLAAATKKIASQQANTTVDTIIGRTTYNARIMQHMWGACQDKNVQPRTYAADWLKTLINKESHHKSHIEHAGGLDLLEKCIKKGLGDANPGVRERMRGTYWLFATVWPAQAEKIMDGLDSTAQKLLQKDPNNPNMPVASKSEPVPRPGLGLSKSTMSANSKPSIRETMMAQKRAMAASAKTLPPRPGSAMATVTPARTTSGSSGVSAASSAAPPTTRTRADTAGKPHAGISAAPMRPTRRRPETARPEMAPRPATAGPYSGRNHDVRSSPPDIKSKTVTPKTISGSPRRTVPKGRPGHQPTRSVDGIATPSKPILSKSLSAAPSPINSPAKAKQPGFSGILSSNSSKENEELTLVVPTIASLRESMKSSPKSSPKAPSHLASDETARQTEPMDLNEDPVQEVSQTPVQTPSKTLKVYEDPFVDEQTTRPAVDASPERPVLEDKPVNEDAANLNFGQNGTTTPPAVISPDKNGQNARLLDSGIKRIKAQTLDVHGFRKLQSLLRDSKSPPTDSKFDTLLTGLFEYLESPLDNLEPAKIQDIKAQVLATIKLLLKNSRDNFQPHIALGLEALLATRANYDARTHIVSGLELLAEELVKVGDPPTMAVSMTRRCGPLLEKTDARSGRSLQMGIHIMKQLVENHPTYNPSESELQGMCSLSANCLDSKESGVRMDAVHLCVQLHARVGEQRFWESMKGLKDDPKNLITYYVVKHQRETGVAA
ncbi:HEAT repeat-containing protein [Truncatella angustata]|uniref:HEAT repeat-containing protein n=1 Tax=Truncatella angustata TaxID=152316 RepID=A0A9P9A1P6_9PEZI|nr:HEAT repeat-containing protein [Truncatella angustata]KAH6659791.1 HEAT repeat-containing protein [Truncatella angustata]